MVEPHIQYVRTSDGVNLAYFMMGEGSPPIVMMDVVYSHLQAEWNDPEQRRVYETITGITTLVRYDHRGFGMSDRGVEMSMDGFVLDLETVVERTIPGRPFVLIAERGVTTPMAVTYAVRHPEQLTHLVLTTPMARFPKEFIDQMDALTEAPGANERFVSEALARLVQGWDDDDASRSIAARMRESVSLDEYRRFNKMGRSWDVRDILPEIRTPTLLTTYKNHPVFGVEYAREIAASVPGARVAVIEGATSAERGVSLMGAVVDFLGGGRIRVPAPAPAAEPQGVPSTTGSAVILFTDIVSSTELTERMGDARFRDASRALDSGLRNAIREAGGAAIDRSLGDGVLATFPSAAQAIDGARRCLALSAASELGLHIGLHAGDVIREDNNVYGGAVNIASRICGLSAPGEILVSDVVRGMARSSAGVEFEDRGEQEMKGVGEPVRVYAVRSAS